ncbi:MAG: hypothetical protein HY689_15110 [Chloroflexi bacterium]|nr:hypothetical protein [Chloroflexota bacterium]
MMRRTKDEPRDEVKWREGEEAVQALQQLLQQQKDPRLQPVKVWLNRINEERGMMYLGISLGEALGCSPFCGCAAKQIGEQFEPFLLERVPWLTRVIVEPQAPTEDDPGHLLLKLF